MSHRRARAKKVTRSAARIMGLAALLLAVIGMPTSSGVADAQSRTLGAKRALAAPDWSASHVPDQLLVKLTSSMSAGTRAVLAAAGTQVVETIPQLGLAVVETTPSADLAVAAADLAASPDVEWAEPNYIFSLDAVPNDPYYSYQSPYLDRMQMPDAWASTNGRPEVVIAILDTGVDLTHEDLSGGIWTNSDEVPGNEIDDDLNGFIDDVHGWDFANNENLPDDDYGHGTHVAGIAAARINNGVGIAGMAGQATIMPVDVFKRWVVGGRQLGTYADLIRAIIYATDNGARVINMSLGATSYSRGEEAAVDYASSHGVVLVASAGNSGTNTYHYPAAHEHVIAVAGTNSSDGWAGYAYGDFVDVAAPGVSVWSTYWGNSYSPMSGTSMAAPHVSGLVALVLSLNPDLTPDQVRYLIEQNADDVGATGWDPYFGHGRINAFQTLSQVTPNPNPSPTPPPGPPLDIWPAGCQELISDGDFETGLGEWQYSGSVSVTDKQFYSGARSAAFPGGPYTHSVLTRTLALPSLPITAALSFAYRIETSDGGKGSSPLFPYDDWLKVEFRSSDGQLIQSLLRTGNSADTYSIGLPWDKYLYRMQSADFEALGAPGPVNLVFSTGNDGDSLPTNFWIDDVRFCPRRVYLPTITR